MKNINVFKNFILKNAFIKYIQKNIKKMNKTKILQLYGLYHLFKYGFNFFINSKYYLRYQIKQIPFIKNKISDERNKIIVDLKKKFNEPNKNLDKYYFLPNQGIKSEKIIEKFDNMIINGSIDYKQGYVSGATYSNNNDLDILLTKLFPYFNKSNPLHTNMYPSIRKMEQECISIMINLFNGDINTCGIFTSGGTESILMACKTYRDYALDKKNIKEPEIIVSDTVHCAFNKACKYFNIKMVIIKSNKDGLYDLNLLKKSINKNTILIVASTPSYNLGLIDQVDKLNQIALKYKIPLHLDACIGTFLINFTKYNYGFTLDGITSISADFHKYGNSPKGASSILYKNKELMKYQYFIDEKWSGGIYASSAISGSRCGNIVALTWATLLYYGNEGYYKNYIKIMERQKYLVDEINKIDDLFIYGEPELSIVGIGSKNININVIADEIKKKKWEINVIQNPNGFHFCVTSYHTKDVIKNFISDIKNVIIYIKKNNTGNVKYSPCIYGTMSKIGDTQIMHDVISDYLHVLNGAL